MAKKPKKITTHHYSTVIDNVKVTINCDGPLSDETKDAIVKMVKLVISKQTKKITVIAKDNDSK
jgi:hypothetical protein